MKKLTLLCIFLIFQYTCFTINMSGFTKARETLKLSNIKPEAAYSALMESHSIGYDYHDIYSEVLAKEDNAGELFEKLFYEANNNTGKIFALEALYKIDNVKYKELKTKVRGKVIMNHGCYFTAEKAQKYIKNMEQYLEEINFESQ